MHDTKKTVLVTGCSAGGVGAAIAQVLANHGHTVFATARNTTKIPPTLSEHPNVTTLQLDVLSADSIAEATKAVAAATNGRLDVLVNNAGAGYTMPVLDLDIEQARRIHDTNVWGPVRTIQAFSDLLIASKGRIVNVSSVGAVVNTPWISAYASSKAALNSIADTLRLELAPFGVSVVSIMLGAVATDFRKNEPRVVLPEGSRYGEIVETIWKWGAGEAGPKGGSAEEVAESLLKDIVGAAKPAQVWKGRYSGTMKFVSRWLPTFVADSLMSIGQGLAELKQSVSK